MELGELAGYLYSCDNTMEDISGGFERFYGKRYSASQINCISLSTSKEVEAWRYSCLPRVLVVFVSDASFPQDDDEKA